MKLWAFGLLRVFAFVGLGLASSRPENTPSGANFQCSNILSSVKSMQYGMGAKLPRWVDLIEHYRLPPKTDRTGQWANPSLNVWSSNRELADGSSKIGGVEMSEFALLHIKQCHPFGLGKNRVQQSGIWGILGSLYWFCEPLPRLSSLQLFRSLRRFSQRVTTGRFSALLPSEATVMSPGLLIVPALVTNCGYELGSHSWYIPGTNPLPKDLCTLWLFMDVVAIAVTVVIAAIDLIVIIVPLLTLCPLSSLSSLSSFLSLLVSSRHWSVLSCWRLCLSRCIFGHLRLHGHFLCFNLTKLSPIIFLCQEGSFFLSFSSSGTEFSAGNQSLFKVCFHEIANQQAS